MAEWRNDMPIGRWYQADGDPFEVVGIDMSTEVVLVQHFDGTLKEFDFDSCVALAARPCAPPENLRGAFDTDRDDFGLNERYGSDEWRDPLERLDQLGLTAIPPGEAEIPRPALWRVPGSQVSGGYRLNGIGWHAYADGRD